MKICIIGGGNTGWWAAGYLEHKFPNFDITLIESPIIPKIGVGESTLPQIGFFFKELGMEESEWMPKCNAVYKTGNKKYNWIDDDPFTFTFWYNAEGQFDEWVKKYFDNKVDKDDLNKSLYYSGSWASYAYHLDAEQAGLIVKDNCKKINHIYDTIDELPKGYDLYLDCTGFSRKFVKDKTLIEDQDHLVDRAWVCAFEQDEILPYTESIARDYGWQFNISLQNRMGSGYIYSSKHVTDDEALLQFKQYTKEWNYYNGATPRPLKWKPGYLANPWVDNVVSIGLSNGFIDPLEANGLYMSLFSIQTLVKCLERNYKPATFNKLLRKTWLEVSRFVKHHYLLTNKVDNEFWKHYKEKDARKSLWENYNYVGNDYRSLYPSSLWASLGTYFNEFTYYKSR